MNKLRSLLPHGSNNANRNSGNLEPELGFQLIFDVAPQQSDDSNRRSKSTPQLIVNLIAARHLPSTFGFKTVQGYVVKVKLFPGATKYDSCIQTNSWPKFNENFKFSLEPDRKSSFKASPSKTTKDGTDSEIDKFFCGQFVVFTVYALLELPPGNFNRINKTYQSIRDRSASIVQKISDQTSTNGSSKNAKTKENTAAASTKENDPAANKKNSKEKEPVPMTKTESRRNIGSVTCYLEPKIFRLCPRNINQYLTEELWRPIKDLTASPIKTTSTATSRIISMAPSNAAKGQLELVLELCNGDLGDSLPSIPAKTKSKAQNKEEPASSKKNVAPTEASTSTKKPWVAQIKRKISLKKSKLTPKDFILKVSTTKFRCSIKVKDELESVGSQLYVKTAIYDGDVPIKSWKSDHFTPSLSLRWEPIASTIQVPLPNLDCLSRMRVKTTIATKSKVGKKIVLGTVVLSSNATEENCAEHWNNAVRTRNEAVTMWHNFA